MSEIEVGLESSETEAQSVQSLEGSRSEYLPKGSSKVTEISMGGTRVKVKTDATPALLKQIKHLVEAKFEETAGKSVRGAVSAHQLSVLVAFNLAEELLAERERVRLLKRHLAETSERLINRVETHLKKT